VIPGRNDPCPCGSGKKYKKCCQNKLAAQIATQTTQPKVSVPSPTEISQFVHLFNSRRYTEMENLARELLERYPSSGFAWKALGAVLGLQGKNSLLALQKATELIPDDAEAHYNLGNALKDLGQLEDAVRSYHLAIKLKPDYAVAHSNLGNVLKDLGQLEDAVASYHLALKFKPNYADAHSNLGNVLKDLGQLDDALASYRRALEIKPEFAEAHSNLGIALQDLGRLDDAVACYHLALKFKSDYAEAHYNLGIALQDLGRLDDAVACYHQALKIKPNHVETYINLALLFSEQGKFTDALSIIKQSMLIKETSLAKRIFVSTCNSVRLTRDDNDLRASITRALAEHWGRPTQLARIGIDVVRFNSGIRECITRATNAWPLHLPWQDLFRPNELNALADDELLIALLISTPICNIEMERFLTTARFAMLEIAANTITAYGRDSTALRFYGALAQQCFINEYVFSHTDEEIHKARQLRDLLSTALDAKSDIPALWPVAVSAYFPLNTLPLANRLFDSQFPDSALAVIVQQVREPEEELQLRATIPRLTIIEDEVSLLVQNQYEENPYPRWIIAASTEEEKTVIGYLCRRFPLASFNRKGSSRNIDILIAGCGTGQHSVETAQQFKNARVLAVDLSMSSLAYAKRKTRELCLSSIEYGQADLLRLGSLDRSFDVIESIGVLHHLADPLAGWRVLLSLLRPGGFMRLGFYSEVARRNIVLIRNYIADQGYGSSAYEIRSCRQELIELDKSENYGTATKSADFFSISSCRDLLFHIKEHRMSLTDIEVFLRENNLVFLGFDVEGEVLQSYKRRFTNDQSATNLKQWQIFENENPDTFSRMYQFWIQKIG
jgi:tetratricopeptide (TPR) repeat protein/SAM-dependent methyltransferase